jgi:MFS family permease
MSSFAQFWTAQAVSRFGDPITLIALTIVTYRETRSALYTALAVVIAQLPTAAFGFVGGAIADALGPRRAMVICDFARAILIALVPVLIGTGAPLALIYGCVFLSGVFGAIFNPARIAVIPLLVPPERLGQANAVIGATDRTLEIIGALAAGFLVAFIGAGAFYIDALTFLISALLLLRIKTPPPPRVGLSIGSVVHDTGAGLRFLFASPILRANTVFSLVAQLALPVVNGLTPTLLIRRFANGNAELGATLFGAAEASLAAGAIIAGMTLPDYLEHGRKGRFLIGGFAAYGVLLVLLGFAPSLLPALVIFFCIGAANIVFLVPNITISQEVTPPELRARVAGARMALLNITWLPMIAISGALGDYVDAGVLVAIAGALTLTTALIGAFLPTVRDVP